MPILVFGFIFMLGIGMNYVATSSITRENNSAYILKIIPVSYKTIIQAKLIMGLAVAIIAIFVSLLTAIISLHLNILMVIVITGALLILAYAFTCLALDTDIRKPRLHYTSIASGLKNSPSSLASMLASFVFTGIIAIIFVSGYMWLVPLVGMIIGEVIMWSAVYVISIILAIIFHKRLYNGAEQKLSNILV